MLRYLIPLSFLITLSSSLALGAVAIDQQSIEKDLRFLASDELKGRGNFDPAIDVAAAFETDA